MPDEGLKLASFSRLLAEADKSAQSSDDSYSWLHLNGSRENNSQNQDFVVTADQAIHWSKPLPKSQEATKSKLKNIEVQKRAFENFLKNEKAAIYKAIDEVNNTQDTNKTDPFVEALVAQGMQACVTHVKRQEFDWQREKCISLILSLS